jgi:fructose-bisphosphate aldolase, class II
VPVHPVREILNHALCHRYGVGAFNIVNDLSMEAVLSAANELHTPVIIQASVKTVRQMGARVLRVLFEAMAERVAVPVGLHLDHCHDRMLIEECIEAGWDSVLFDASGLSYEENLRQTKEVVAFARRHDAAVEGELEAIRGVEDGLGSDQQGMIVPLDKALQFIRETGISSFAPAIGTAHGLYARQPQIDFARVTEILDAVAIPLVVHGGTGLAPEVIQELIRRGAVKVNVSTQLKITLIQSLRLHLGKNPDCREPLELLARARCDVRQMALDTMSVFQCAKGVA